MTLALEYRPIRFADVVGQNHIKPILRAMVRTERVPPALLFSGSRGTGKTTTGRILSAALNCAQRTEDGDACAQCASCVSVQSGTSMAMIEVDAASHGLVDDIRKIRDVVAYSHAGDWRIILLDEAQSMSKEAFNALLKVLEEPPAGTVFVLLTTEARRILETVRSRSMTFEFRRLATGEIAKRLRYIADERAILATDELLREIAVRVQGGMRDAVMLLDQVSRVDVRDVEGFRELFSIRDTAPELFMAAMDRDVVRGTDIIEEHFYRVGDPYALVNDIVLLTRDLFVVRAGGTPRVASQEELEVRERLAERVDEDHLASVMRVLWELRSRMRSPDDQRAAVEMAFVLVMEALHDRPRGAAVMPMKNGESPVEAQLSLAEMAQMVRGSV